MSNEEAVPLTNASDVFFGAGLMGVMLMLSGEDDSRESQIRAVEWFQEGSSSPALKEWCEYQLILLTDEDYSVPFVSMSDFAKLTVAYVRENDDPSMIYACLLASAQFEAGNAFAEGLEGVVLRQYCRGFLGIDPPEYESVPGHRDEMSRAVFKLVTAYNLYTNIVLLGVNNEAVVGMLPHIVADSRMLVDVMNKHEGTND